MAKKKVFKKDKSLFKKAEKIEKKAEKIKKGNKKKESKIEKVMHEYKESKLHSGSKKGPKVENEKQAIAIALSEARKAGEAVKPMKKAMKKKAKKKK